MGLTALIRCIPHVEDQWNSARVRDKSGGILLRNSLGVKPT